jgi:pimeloyl-ACP methyl ester carboxylesterase
LSRKSLTNQIYRGADGRESVYDLAIPENWNNKLVVFIHGYMGYKDWGCWNLVQDFFTNQHFGFLKYNVSHNGGTVQNPIDFPDLDAFRKNSYPKELFDLDAVLRLVKEQFQEFPEIQLIGHSRGGGIALLQSTNPLVSKISTWAGISYIKERSPSGKEREEWKRTGIYYRENGRTKQQMPHDYSQFEEILDHEERMNIAVYCRQSIIPTLVIHGDDDTSVNIREGQSISSWLNVELSIIEGANHTFGASQPWLDEKLPSHLQQVCEKTIHFFNQ